MLLHGVILIATLFLLVRKQRDLVFGWAMFFVALMPTSSIIPIADIVMEYRLYLPAIGLALLVAGLLIRLGRWGRDRSARIRLVIAVLVLLWISVHLVWLKNRLDTYHSAESLWADAAEKSPENPRTWYNLANSFAMIQQPEKALQALLRAESISPENPKILMALGDLYRDTDDRQQAIAYYRRVLEVEPANMDVLVRVTYLLIEAGDLQTAGKNLSLIGSRSRSREYYLTLALFLSETGREKDAIALYRQVLKTYPAEKTAWLNLGHLVRRDGLLSEAERCYREALKIDHRYSRAEIALGRLFMEMGRLSEAMTCLDQAERHSPSMDEVYYERGNLLATLRKYDKAETQYRMYLRDNPDQAEAWHRLYMVLLELGRIRDAEIAQQRWQRLTGNGADK
jgi:tetratricopeptide (TPR) repeat protein